MCNAMKKIEIIENKFLLVSDKNSLIHLNGYDVLWPLNIMLAVSFSRIRFRDT